jgi:beta-glucosidase
LTIRQFTSYISGESVTKYSTPTVTNCRYRPFQDAIHAGTANIMCSYNRINNSYASANSKTLNGILKTELGYQGFVVSDWGGQHAGVASALAGLDVAMPNPASFWGSALVEAVTNGSVPESRVTDMATR